MTLVLIFRFNNYAEVNANHIYLPHLAIDDWYPRDKISVCLLSALSNGNENSDIITLDDVDTMTILEIVNKIESSRTLSESLKSKTLKHHSPWNSQGNKSALVIISPDAEDSKLEMTVRPQSTNATVVIGGVRVIKRENKKLYTLSMSVAVNCMKCSVGMCRRFAEHVQKSIQEPVRL